MDRPPQIDRLLRLIDGLETPVVQVWGWPGSGRSALLAALLGRDGAAGLAPLDLSEGAAAVREAVAGGASLLVCHALPRDVEPEEMLRSLAEALPAGRRLVVATSRQVATPDLLSGLLTPSDLALTTEEAAELWQSIVGRELEREDALRLVRSTDGWYRPLRLVAEAAAELGGVAPVDAAEVVKVPAVERFLRHQVLFELSGRELGDLAGTVLIRAYLARPGAAVPGPGALSSGLSPRPGLGIRYELRLLGRPEVHRLGPDLIWHRISFTLKKGFRVLAYLATSPERRASREELVEELWPESDREAIGRNFHPTLSHLRRDLRRNVAGGSSADLEEVDPLLHQEGLYELDPEIDWWIDVDELRRLAEEGRRFARSGLDERAAETWQAAWRLYRGPLLDGVYDPWAAARRDALHRLHLDVLRRLGEVLERLGRPGEATDAYRALLAEDPLQEAVHVALMRFYAGRGRRDLVRRQYERLSNMLRSELGVEPLPETTEEYHRLMLERA